MERYDSYEDSGIEWIGDIPSHWEVTKYKYHFRIKGGFPFNSELITNDPTEFPIIRIGNVTSGEIDVYYSGELFEKIPVVDKGDYVISLTGDFRIRRWEGKTALLNQRCGLILPLGGLNRKYLFYFLPLTFSVIEKTKYFTTLKNLSNSEVKDIEMCCPPPHEQEQIVAFLDRKTTLLDSLIEKTVRKIELLKEKRTSLINEVVTKGLNPDVEMKDSGVEWIGEIPTHWDKNRLDFLFRLYGRLGWKSLKADEYVDDGYVFLSTPNLKGKCIDYENVNFITKQRYDESPEIMLENGDVLLVKDGSTLGIVNIVENLPRPSTVNSSIGVLKRKSDEIIPRFMFYFLKSNFSQKIIDRIKGGMGVPHLFQSDIKKFLILVPTLKEQKEIINHLDEQTSTIDSSITREEKRIELLKEYRQSLISEVVTGKVKVAA